MSPSPLLCQLDRPQTTDAPTQKPVSSLLSHFENMGKDQPQSAQPTQQPSSRNASPGPRPREPNPPATAKEPPPVPKKPGLAPPAPRENGASQRSPARSAFPPPPLTPRAKLEAPELNVEPPMSPPQAKSPVFATNNQSLLNPDDVVKPAATPTGPGKQPKIPTRPASTDRGRSPSAKPAFKPPSPPPPRRSAELRRQREDAPRPSLDSPRMKRRSWMGDGAVDVARANLMDRVSPFSSPPSSGSASFGEESPPALPRRPGPRDPVPNAQTLQIGFAAPPQHPATVGRRREREAESNGSVRGQITPNITGEPRPTIPARPQSTAVEKPPTTFEKIPPPRPPRGPPSALTLVTAPSAANQKRTVSTPVHRSPSPARAIHGRSNTVSHRNAEWSEPRHAAAASLPPEPRADTGAITPLRQTDLAGAVTTGYPDASNVNRRPPYIKHGQHEIVTKSDPRNFDVSGDRVVASGHLTRVWSLRDGELLMSLAHGEGLKATAVAFKPGANVDEEGKRLWIGNNNGDLIEVDIETSGVVTTRPGAHVHNEILRIYRHFNELWTLDDAGTLHIWAAKDDHVPDMTDRPDQSFRVPKGHSFSMVVGDQLWHAAGKEVRVFYPTLEGKAQFQVLLRSLFQESAGEVTSGCLLPSAPDKVFFGHSDGKVSVYSRKDYSCLELLNVSTFKINSLQGSCGNIWAGYSNGGMDVYDTAQSPWVVKKEWQAHDNPIIRIIADRSGCYQLGRHQVLSLGADNMIRVWDGMLQDDWLEEQMKARDVQYCQFDTLKAMIMTWNAGASTPNSLRYSDADSVFIQNLLQSSDSPDILIFGFQELVDLEDKTATAKRFFKSKKKESDQERMSHQYRDWRDFLIRSLDDYLPATLYHLLQTIHMVGLFTCVFVKADVRARISQLSTAEVKRGMGGLHGNKGAIVVRFLVDDTSLCFFNCHLAAGQSQAQSRNNDITAILEANLMPPERDPNLCIDNFTGGGDGSMILDHELVILNGDLNYRIDTMSRDTVVMAVKQNNLSKLLDRDQLLVARRRKPDLKLRIFEEMPITFAPTYKYDVGTDKYDSSEKKRSPAWCDRLLFRGRGRIRQLEYRRHEVRVSDHRPVTGRFELVVKKTVPKERAKVWMECQQEFEDAKDREVYQEK